RLGPVPARSPEAGRCLPRGPRPAVAVPRPNLRNDHQRHPASIARAKEQPADPARFRPLLAKLVPPMLAACETEARRLAATETGAALDAAQRELEAERARLVALARVNPAVREEEIDAISAELEDIRHALSTAAPRLDAIRFVCSPDIAAR